MTPGGVVATAALAGMIFGPVARLADLAYVFEQTAASVDRLGEILDLEPDVVEPAAGGGRGRCPARMAGRGAVEFDRVGFGYRQGEPVVWDIRLNVEPGMKVALVGPTGCGKSTLVNLLLRFYDPTWGEIRLDGVPIRDLPTRTLRGQVGVVLQEPVVFRDERGRQHPLRGAGGRRRPRPRPRPGPRWSHEFAEALPEGYATIVGEGGYKLSQGERQRLAIARALCKEPALVVLDEATSSLDTPSEALIQAALANLLRGRTAFIIAHRLSTIVDADLIVVMDGGLIVQMGTHAQLLADPDGLYRRLCARQFGEGEPISPPYRRSPRYVPIRRRHRQPRGRRTTPVVRIRRRADHAPLMRTIARPGPPEPTGRFPVQIFQEVADKLNRRENRELSHRVYLRNSRIRGSCVAWNQIVEITGRKGRSSMSDAIAVGDWIGNRFQVFDIHEGGMSLVYVVNDHLGDGDRKVVALKTLRSELMQSRIRVSRFAAECRIWTQLGEHPNIVRAHSVEIIDGRPYVVLELVQGGDLYRWIGTPRLDLPQVLAVRLPVLRRAGARPAPGAALPPRHQAGQPAGDRARDAEDHRFRAGAGLRGDGGHAARAARRLDPAGRAHDRQPIIWTDPRDQVSRSSGQLVPRRRGAGRSRRAPAATRPRKPATTAGPSRAGVPTGSASTATVEKETQEYVSPLETSNPRLDAHRREARHRRLHGARAVPRPQVGRRPRRHLLLRDRPLRDDHRPAAVQGPVDGDPRRSAHPLPARLRRPVDPGPLSRSSPGRSMPSSSAASRKTPRTASVPSPSSARRSSRSPP